MAQADDTPGTIYICIVIAAAVAMLLSMPAEIRRKLAKTALHEPI